MSNIASPSPAPVGRLLSTADVIRETSLARTTLWRRVKDGTFPPPVPLGGIRKGWPERDVERWKAERDQGPWQPK